MNPVISVFGSSAIAKDSVDYQIAYEVGCLLAEAGFTVMSGGYMGTMEAVSKGANETGGHVIGVTSDEIERFRPIGPNPWVKEEIRYESGLDRLIHLVFNNVGMIALAGGIGTLAEISVALNVVQTVDQGSRPLVTLGEHWRDTLSDFVDSIYVGPNYRHLINFALTPKEAVALIIEKAPLSKVTDEPTPSSANRDAPIFLKLGGSLITDKTEFEKIRPDILKRVATEIAEIRQSNPNLKLLLGHGSGSFGHYHAHKHGTRVGVESHEGWLGFLAVSDSALRLNRIVVNALIDAGVPAISLSPSASASVADCHIKEMAVEPIQAALKAGLVPVIHGDVAFDQVRGGTILSTEEIMTYLAGHLKPSRFLLAGETPGVYGLEKEVIPTLTAENFEEIKPALGGSRGADVTGGMASKVQDMLTLSKNMGGLPITIFSGLAEGNLAKILIDGEQIGTQIH
ncbi:MAG: isopentenyl phosphate kinase [Chloroflexota bacterium]